MTTFDLGAAQTHTVRSRVKHMQLLGFPKKGVGKGFKASYSIEDVMKVVVAFALLEAGIPSVRAHELVTSAWPEVAKAMATGDTDGPGAGADRNQCLIVEPHALSSLGRPITAEQIRREQVSVGSRPAEPRLKAYSATAVTVDLPPLSRRLCEVMSGKVPAARRTDHLALPERTLVPGERYWTEARLLVR
ncbi:hypothetical protein [Sphingomonas faeni]|uniref:hypothetical protein n=1 Tax=Sphingomonas faeni TaxID=185950 RepID=UPI0033564764